VFESPLAEEGDDDPDMGIVDSIVAYRNTMKTERNSIDRIG